MKPHKTHPVNVPLLLSLLLGAVVFVFFFGLYPYHLHYQEQFQLFRFSADYWRETVACPGGVSIYVSRFFVQFWVYSWAGALILASLLCGLQQLVASVMGRLHRNRALYPLTLLPSLAYLVLFCDENYMPAAVIQVIIALSAVCLYRLLRQVMPRMACAVLLIPVVYWMAGGCVWLYIAMVWLTEICYFRQLTRNQWCLLAVATLLAVVGAGLLAKAIWQYPSDQLWIGQGAHRFLLKTQGARLLSYTLVWWLILLIALVVVFMPERRTERRTICIQVCLALCFFTIAAVGVSRSADWEKEELMAYDYHIRMQQWNKAIGLAEKHPPRSSLAAACLNLALGMTGRLGDDLFRYDPVGTADLLPVIERDFTSPLPPGEIYYYLGLGYTAERFAYEAMEAIPDFERSARGLKRLAEVNLINGHYEVACKYLCLLQQSLFYRAWATDAMTYLYDDAKVGHHPEWGKLRARRCTTDILFREDRQATILALLYQADTDNHLAYEYLLAYALLEKDLERFQAYYLFGGEGVEYDRIPRSYQEALLYVWSLEQDIDAATPWAIQPETVARIKTYASLFNTADDGGTVLKKDFGHTFWYYLHFNHNEE